MKNNLMNAGVMLGGVAMQLLSKQKNQDDKSKRLSEQLQMCKYGYSVVPYILRAGQQISEDYPTLVSSILTFYQDKEQKNFIEFKGLVPVQYKGEKYGIQMHIMLPSNYPTAAPFVRIVNIDPMKFVADQFYMRMRSKNDQNSFLLSDLETIKKWGPLSNIAAVIKQAQKLMSNVFPFKRNTQQQNYGYNNEYLPPQGWGQQNQPGFNSPNYGNVPFNQPQGLPVYQVSNLPNGQKDLPSYSSASQKQPPIPFREPVPSQQTQQASNSSNKTKPATGKNVKNEKVEQAEMQRQDYIVRSQIFTNDAKKSTETLRQTAKTNFQNIQNLDQINKRLVSLNELMITEIAKLDKFVKVQQQNDSVDPLDLVVPADEQSKQLLQLLAQAKALDETWNFVESKFTEDKMTFEQFLKMARKVQEDRFVSKYMLKKTKASLKL